VHDVLSACLAPPPEESRHDSYDKTVFFYHVGGIRCAVVLVSPMGGLGFMLSFRRRCARSRVGFSFLLPHDFFFLGRLLCHSSASGDGVFPASLLEGLTSPYLKHPSFFRQTNCFFLRLSLDLSASVDVVRFFLLSPSRLLPPPPLVVPPPPLSLDGEVLLSIPVRRSLVFRLIFTLSCPLCPADREVNFGYRRRLRACLSFFPCPQS